MEDRQSDAGMRKKGTANKNVRFRDDKTANYLLKSYEEEVFDRILQPNGKKITPFVATSILKLQVQ